MLERLRRWRSWPVVAVWAVAVLPIVTAAIRAIATGWRPIGDNALVALRARDVFTSHHPWLGTWSSASLEAGQDLNHPGPLIFDAVALPVRLFGSGAGLVIGDALVNILAVTTVAVFAHRRLGRVAAVVMLVGVVYHEYIMGSELLIDPWNPHVLMLPCFALLVCAWGVTESDRWALPVFLAIGSYCVQTHVGYSYLVPGLLVAALVLRWLRHRRVASSTRWPFQRRELLWSGGVVAVLWSQPLFEQIFGAGEGNLSRIIGARGSDGLTIGPSLSVRLFTSVVTTPPWSARAGFLRAVPFTSYERPGVLRPIDVIGGIETAIRLVLFVAVLGAAAWWSWRRRDRVTTLLMATAASAMLIAVASIVIMPVGPIGLTAHQMRWLWPIGIFAVCGAVLALGAVEWRRSWPVGVAALTVVSVAGIPAYAQDAGPAAFRNTIPVVAALDRQLGVLQGMGTIWVDTSNTPVFDNYDAALMLELQRRGVPFVVDEPGLVRQMGEARRYDGQPAVHLWLVRGRSALLPVADGERVAVASTLSDEEVAELEELGRRISDGEELPPTDSARYDELAAAADVATVAVIISPSS